VANLMIDKVRKKPVARTWGSDRIVNCDHDIIEKNGIMYCKRCGRNFTEDQLVDDGYYTMFD
jgi:hypothetical protein